MALVKCADAKKKSFVFMDSQPTGSIGVVLLRQKAFNGFLTFSEGGAMNPKMVRHSLNTKTHST